MRERLLLPGPVLMAPEVYAAMGRPIVNHRGSAFKAVLEELTEGLRWLFQTQGRILVLTASGTGGMESAVANCFNRGEQVVVASSGSFGERWQAIARAYGLDVRAYQRPWGEPIDPEGLASFGAAHPEAAGILVTHSETSTGTVNDLEGICRAVAGHPGLLVVDAVSSAGAVPFRMDAWGIDVSVTGSQKALAASPGLAFVGVGERARSRRGDLPRFYFDWDAAGRFAARGQTPWTPAVHVAFGVVEALRLLRAEGLEGAWERHRRLGRAVRAGVRALGLELLSTAADSSDTVTAIRLPEGVDGGKLLREIRERTGVVFAGGQGPLAGEVLRFGHLGMVGEADVLAGLAALERVLPDFGVDVPAGAGLGAAMQALR